MNSEMGVTTVSFFTAKNGKIRLKLTREFNHDNLSTIREGLTKDVPENTRYVYFSTTQKDEQGKILGDPNESVRKHKAHFQRLLMQINFLEMNPDISFISPNRKFPQNSTRMDEYNVSRDLLRGDLNATMMECLLRYDSLVCALAKLEDYTGKFNIIAHLAILYAIGGTYLYDKVLVNPCLDWTSNLPGYSVQIMQDLKDFRQLIHKLPHDGSSNYDFEMDSQSLDYRCLQAILNDDEYSPKEEPTVCSCFPADLVFFAYWSEARDRLANLHFPKHTTDRGPIRNIAIFCSCIGHGGAERCATILANHFVDMGYHVFFYTNEPRQEDDYDYSPRIERRVLPKRPHERRAKLRVQLAEDAIDTCIFIDHAEWLEKQDILTAYEMNLSTIAMEHSIFSYPLLQNNPYGMGERLAAYRVADAVTVLSHMDYMYWKNNGFSNVLFMPNPPAIDKAEDQGSESKTSQTLIFVGRLTRDKGVFDALRATILLKKTFPETKLLLVGRSGSPNEEQTIARIIEDHGLEDNVEVVGQTNDVGKYYRQAAIHLMPSKFEGYPMTMLEAKSYGIPTVMYDLPHLEIAKRGCVKVPMADSHWGIFDAIRALFQSPDKLLELGTEAKESLKEFDRDVVFARWDKLFQYLVTPEGQEDVFEWNGTPEEMSYAQQIAMQEMEKAYGDMISNGGYLQNIYRDIVHRFLCAHPALLAANHLFAKWQWLGQWADNLFRKMYQKRMKKKLRDSKWYNGNHGFPSYDDE